MKAKALTDSTIELPEAQIVIEMSNGQKMSTTGFIIRKDKKEEPIIIIKSGRKLIR